MKSKARFYVSFVIMMIVLILMGIHWLLVPMPDWAIRTVGIVMLIDLVVFTYSSIKMKQKE